MTNSFYVTPEGVRQPAFTDLAGTLALAQIGATGTPSSTTFLRGDYTWAAGGSGAPTTSKYVLGDFDGTLTNAAKNSSVYLGPDVCPPSPNSANDEYDDTSGNSGTVNGLNARWTWKNQGSTTISYTKGWAQISGVSNGAAHAARFISQSTPSAPYAFTAKCAFHQGLVNFAFGGLILYESATNKFIIFGWGYNSGLALQASTDSGASPYLGAAVNSLATAQGHLRVERISSTLNFYYSVNGITFDQVLSEAVTTHFTTAPDLVGPGLDPYSQPATLDVDWFRRTT